MTTQVRQKRTRRKKVKHPLFLKCAELESIPYWKSLMESCAYGHLPKGITYKNNTIYYKKPRRKQATIYNIPENEEEALTKLEGHF